MAKKESRNETNDPSPREQVLVADMAFNRSASNASQRSAPISAESVRISISDASGGTKGLSLQNFLDMTGAGALYAAATKLDGPVKRPGLFGMSGSMEDPLKEEDLHTVVGKLWNATNNAGAANASQSFFFKRANGLSEFKTGSIIGLIAGEIVAVGEVLRRKEGLCMVVADAVDKHKGGPAPTPEEEESGHWCCFLGHVPVLVEGAVTRGAAIGPNPSGSGVGVVAHPGRQPVIGVAMSEKLIPVPGLVEVLCFAGLNSLSPSPAEALGFGKPELQSMLDQAAAMSARVQRLEGAMEILDTRLMVTAEITTVTEQQVLSLSEDVEMLKQAHASGRGDLSSKRNSLDSARSPEHVPSAVPHAGTERRGGWRLLLLGAILLLVVVAVAVAVPLALNKGEGSSPEPSSASSVTVEDPSPELVEMCEECRWEGSATVNITLQDTTAAMCANLKAVERVMRECGEAIDFGGAARVPFCCNRLLANAEQLKGPMLALCGTQPDPSTCQQGLGV